MGKGESGKWVDMRAEINGCRNVRRVTDRKRVSVEVERVLSMEMRGNRNKKGRDPTGAAGKKERMRRKMDAKALVGGWYIICQLFEYFLGQLYHEHEPKDM